MGKFEGINIMTPKSRERAILSYLSHGKKRRKEIIKYIATIEEEDEDAVEDTVANKLSKLCKEGKIEKETQGVYYGTDQGSNIIRPKPSANQDVINPILTQLEHSLELTSENMDKPTLDIKTKPELLEDLLELEMYKKEVLHTEENVNRYGAIFEAYVQRIIDRFSIDEKRKETTATVDTVIEYQLLFQLTSGLIMNAQNGQENPELIPEIHSHIQKLSDYSRDLPAKLGLEVQAVARDIYPDRGRDIFLELIKEDSYGKDILAEMAFYTYDVHNESDELFTDLDNEKANTKNSDEKERIRDLTEYITELYRDNLD